MQETGNNISHVKKILSIRLTSSGLSFYVSTPGCPRSDGERRIPFARRDTGITAAVRGIVESTPELSGYFSAVNIFIDTPDTVYAPAEVLRADNVGAFLTASGIYIPHGSGVAVSPVVADLRAAMRYDSGSLAFLRDYYGARVSFYSPLQENLELAAKKGFNYDGFIVNLTERNMYITRFDGNGNLLLSEVYPHDTEADIVYYLYKLTEATGTKNIRIRLFGPESEVACKVLGRYFKGVSCV